MDTEFETKVLGIKKQEIIQKLRDLGAEETAEKLIRRYVFDLTDENVEWIRLRTDGTKTTLTYKYKVRGNKEIGKTTEIEVEAGDFDKTAQILSKVPFKDIFYQENKRHTFRHQGIEYSLDTWPLMDPFLEIEADSKEKVEEGLQVLGLEGAGDIDIVDMYRQKGIELHSYKELKFNED